MNWFVTRTTRARGKTWLLAALLAVPPLQAQQPPQAPQPEEKRKEEGLPLKPTRKIEFTTDEGTWMSLDVSPDGKQIVFDLLGDLYLIGIEGGEAKRLAGGLPWDCEPRFSPDGTRIAFISDRSGSDNVWIMNADGTNPRAVTKETDWQLGSPAWTPDGNYIVARKLGPYPTPDDFIRGVALWMYHKDGGRGVELVRGRGATTINTGVSLSADGAKMYFSSHPEAFRYDADPGRFQVYVQDRETGETNRITAEYGGGLRPVVSPDGRWLVYATRHDAQTGLRLRDLRTQEEKWLAYPIQRDDQEGFAQNDVLPGYAFTPDSSAVIFTAGGKIRRVEMASRRVATIPFTAKVELDLGPRIHARYRIDDGPLAVRQMRWMNASPDGKLLAFSAVGKLWRVEVPNGKPQRLTSSTLREYEPVFSPDGKWIAFTSWSDAEGGHLWKVSATGGQPVRLSATAAYYALPRWSPDGEKILFVMGSARGWLTGDPADIRQLRWMSAAGGESHFVMNMPGGAQSPTFNRDGTRVYYMDAAPPPPPGQEARPARLLRSVRLDGVDKKSHLRFEGNLVTAIPSPDGQWVALHDKYDAYVVALPKTTGDPVAINLQSPAVPVKRVTTDGANYVQWADGGTVLTWSFANRFYRLKLDEVLRKEKREEWKLEQSEIALEVPRAIPQGKLLLRNARIVTMKGREVIERGDILVENNRIREVGPAGRVTAPADAKAMDLRGKTIIPGLVDIHAHLGARRDVVTDQEWSYAANLAYGVTTTRDPSIDSNQVFAQGELVEAGELTGPRIYATGTAMTIYSASITGQEDANNIVRRYKRQGADSLKQYLQPRRIQRQWLAIAAEKEGVNLTAEGGGDLKRDLTMVMDGYTGFEHNLPQVPVYKDVIELIAQAKTTYTPTLVVSFGAYSGQFYWRQRMDIHADSKVMRFTPHETVDRRSRRRPLNFDEEYNFPLIARSIAEIVKRGGHAGLGSHGEQQGIGAHWELWMLQSGGMSNWETLYVATMLGAESIGLDKEIGSLEPGKLADLVVLNANPLDDIRNSKEILYVMKNGVLYSGDTLDALWPVEKKFPRFFWQISDEELKALPK
jgi:Tol biopolymer transport system component/imidazolonepropionase-like amidohydrolase